MEGLNLKFDEKLNMLKEEFTNYEPNNVTIGKMETKPKVIL